MIWHGLRGVTEYCTLVVGNVRSHSFTSTREYSMLVSMYGVHYVECT